MNRVTLRVFGMDCAACGPQLRRALLRQQGVTSCEVSYATSKAILDVDTSLLDMQSISAAVQRAGFALPMEQVRLQAENSTAASRAAEKLRAWWAVQTVSAEDGIVLLTLYPVGLSARDVQQTIDNDACAVLSWDTGEEALEQNDQLAMLRRLLLSVALTTPIFWSPAPWVQLILATLLQMGPGRYFYRGALRALRGRLLNMDFLIALSTTVIYGYSAVLTFAVHDNVKLYYLCEGVLLSLVFFGKYLEIIARGETAKSIRALVHLIPQTAIRIENGMAEEVPAECLRIGDIVRIEAGVRVPADGILQDGVCLVDESVLTGESELVTRRTGDSLTGGALNRSGTATMLVTRVGRDTTLQRMIAMVQEAQNSRAPVQALADRIAGVFIPAVLFIALLTWAIWFFWAAPGVWETSLVAMCGVLVVACPCALGLATPTSIMVGTGRAAELGILFRSAQQLECASHAQVVVFDKTGTLTEGASRETGTPDMIRADAVETVRRLKAQKREVVMLSGDRYEVAQRIAAQAGIGTVRAEMTPEQKAAYICVLRQSGKCVVMVGDGVNDAPALASADVSITLPGATDAAREAAGIVLTTNRLTAVPQALCMAGDTMRNIRGNLLWALCYNLACIPLAGCGIMNPSIASAAMSFSSIAVLMHALRLKKAGTQEERANGKR